MSIGPGEILAARPMARRQVLAVSLCVFLNALDGFDILSISFAAPGISAEWQLSKTVLGLILSIELIGMSVGSITLGVLADRHGRRPLTLCSLLLMSIGMGFARHSSSLQSLVMARLLTGLGIGGMVACTNAMASEFANRANRNLAVTLMAAGYPLGVVAGGLFVSQFVPMEAWRDIFRLGFGLTLLSFFAAAIFLPETVPFLDRRRATNDLTAANRILAKFGHPPACAFGPLGDTTTGLRALWSRAYLRPAILLTFAYFAHIATFYFLLKWSPKILVDMGYSSAIAGGMLVWVNVGGAAGALTISVLSRWVSIRRLLLFTLSGTAVGVVAFGAAGFGMQTLSLICFLTGFCSNGAVVCFYALLADVFPPHLRASATGIVTGLGRGGAILSPLLVGTMLGSGIEVTGVSLIMAAGSLGAAAAVWLLHAARLTPGGAAQGAVSAERRI